MTISTLTTDQQKVHKNLLARISTDEDADILFIPAEKPINKGRLRFFYFTYKYGGIEINPPIEVEGIIQYNLQEALAAYILHQEGNIDITTVHEYPLDKGVVFSDFFP